MLVQAHMGGMEEMGMFYDDCLEELYPPGSCGTFCNEHTYDCYLTEVQQACCDEEGTNCREDSDVPNVCPVGCAIVFPEFLETCREHVTEHEATDASIIVAEFEEFEQQCLNTNGLALVEYVLELVDRGCIVNLTGVDGGRHRRLQQFLMQRLSSGAEHCAWDEIDDLAQDVTSICCTDHACPEGSLVPSSCSPGCAVALHQFTVSCGSTLLVIDQDYEQIMAFEQSCMDAADPLFFLDAIKNAQCDGLLPPPPPPPPPRACMDLTADRVVNINDLLYELATYGASTADIDDLSDPSTYFADATVGVRDLLHLLADYGTSLDAAAGCNDPTAVPSPGTESVIVVSTDGVAGMTTVRLAITLDATQSNVYAMAGVPDYTMSFPPAFQAAAPFGSDIGGVPPAFFPVFPESEFDSWLTIGVTDGSAVGALVASPGFDIAALWSETTGLNQNDAAIFYMDPATMGANSGSDPIVMAQMTLSAADAARGTATAKLQGRSEDSSQEDWTYLATWTWSQ
eukprot:SAG31_NODE_2260_length_6065_cov_3.729802_2_plen_513_part_00